MQRRVAIATHIGEAFILGAYAGRLIDGKLFRDGDVHAHVQERIGLAFFGCVVAIDKTIGLIQNVVILRMHQRDFDRDGFQAFQRGALAIFAPGVEKKLTDLLASGIEHGGECGCGYARILRVAAGLIGSAIVFALYSHKSTIGQRQHSGLRATQT